MKDSIKPTEKELEILQILWKDGQATVRAINEQIASKKEVGYTTTLKLMQIMHEKGIVGREKKGKTHIYKAIISESNTQKQLLDKLMDVAFQGSAMKLVMQALGNKKSSQKELDEIKAYITNLEQDNG